MDKDIEKCALCSIIARPAEGYKAITKHNITPDCFTIGLNRVLFEVLELMLSKAEGFTKQAIFVRLKALDGSYDISMLEEIMGMGENRPLHWCDLVRQQSMCRHSLSFMDEARKKMRNVFNVEDTLTDLSEDLFQLLADNKVDEGNEDSFDDMVTSTGYPSYLAPVREVIINYPCSFPVLIGARPGCGKTTYGLRELLAHVLRKKGDWYDYKPNRHAAMFSLEMPRKDINRKAVCMLSGIDERKVRAGKLDAKDMEKLRAYHDLIRKAPIFIYDKSMTPRQICTNMRFTAERNGTTFMLLDYVQRVRAYSGRSKDREFYMRASNDIADTLKNLPSEPMMIILSQLARSADMNSNMTTQRLKEAVPTLKDFKETGALEEDAYCAGVLYPDPDLMKASSSTEQYIILEWLKNRGGETGCSKLMFKKRHQHFEKRS
jgi:replicative DNA helicase